MIYPVSGLIIERGGKPKARNMPGFASLFQKGEEEEEEEADETEEVEESEEAEAEGDEDEEYQTDKEEAIAEGNDMPQHLWDDAGRSAGNSRSNTEMETRWVLGSRPRRVAESSAEAQEGHDKEGFRQAFVRNVRAVVARRTGERVRKPTQFFDEERMLSAAEDGSKHRKREKKIGDNKRYASINVRTLAMKGDKNRKEACGQTAAVVEWIMEFEARGLGVVGLQVGVQDTRRGRWAGRRL
jgi:hypothetical protein